MEVVGIIVIAIAFGMWYGVFNSLERGANMANRRVAQYEREQKVALAKEINAMDINTEDVTAAKAKAKEIDELDL